MDKDLIGRKGSLKLLYLNIFPMEFVDPKETDCLWVLSTGRCGTTTLTQVLDASPNTVCLHEPMPRFTEYYVRGLDRLLPRKHMMELIRLARLEVTSVMKALGYNYAEAGHHMTPLAPFIKSVYPKSRFVYLRRDMDGFAKSAFNWNIYHPENDRHLRNRPKPKEWIKTRGQKCAWLWCRINTFIINYLKTISREDWYFLDFEKIKNHDLGDFFNQMDKWGFEPPREELIESILFAKINQGPRGEVIKDWHMFYERAERIGEFDGRG